MGNAGGRRGAGVRREPGMGGWAMEVTRIEVHGLPDDDAAARLEKELTGRTGVPRASIDPTVQLAEVTYDPEHVSPDDILRWIEAAGYDARFAGRRAG